MQQRQIDSLSLDWKAVVEEAVRLRKEVEGAEVLVEEVLLRSQRSDLERQVGRRLVVVEAAEAEAEAARHLLGLQRLEVVEVAWLPCPVMAVVVVEEEVVRGRERVISKNRQAALAEEVVVVRC